VNLETLRSLQSRIEQLEATLLASRDALTKIRAASIKGAYLGYGKPETWADELYASHHDVHEALKRIDALLPQDVANES
jgi:hypothetical protein